jgi:Bacterial PH domain
MCHEYAAPWCRGVVIARLLSTLLLCAVPIIGLNAGPHELLAWRGLVVAMPLIALPLGLRVMVRGYRASADGIEIERFGWSTPRPLAGPRRLGADPQALAGSVRHWGNGGFFGITGFYSNPRYGRLRAWATDAARAVVLQFGGHAVMRTPHDPQRFVREAGNRAGLAT